MSPPKQPHGAGGDHAFGRPPDARRQVDAAAGYQRRQAGHHVPVGDLDDTGAGRADASDQLHVAGLGQHGHLEARNLDAERRRDRGQVFLDGCLDVDRTAGARTDHQLVHVETHNRSEGMARRRGQDGDRARPSPSAQVGSLQRVHGQIEVGAEAAADLLAREEHWRVVLLALADHDHPVAGNGRQVGSHGLDRGMVRGMLVTPADPGMAARRSHRGGVQQRQCKGGHAVGPGRVGRAEHQINLGGDRGKYLPRDGEGEVEGTGPLLGLSGQVPAT